MIDGVVIAATLSGCGHVACTPINLVLNAHGMLVINSRQIMQLDAEFLF